MKGFTIVYQWKDDGQISLAHSSEGDAKDAVYELVTDFTNFVEGAGYGKHELPVKILAVFAGRHENLFKDTIL